jgi:hypothetical protein
MDPNVILLIVAIVNAFTALMAWQTKRAAEKTEINTNHMREQLVDSTKIASHAEGKEEGRAEGKADAAILAQGNLEASQAGKQIPEGQS